MRDWDRDIELLQLRLKLFDVDGGSHRYRTRWPKQICEMIAMSTGHVGKTGSIDGVDSQTMAAIQARLNHLRSVIFAAIWNKTTLRNELLHFPVRFHALLILTYPN